MRNPIIRSAARTDSGFTLLEVMLALAILGVGLMSIAVAQITAMKMASKSKNLQQAMFLAREAIDDLEALPGGSPTLSTAATIADPANPIQVGTDPSDETRFTRSTQIIPNSPEADVAQVIVTVTWATSNVTGAQQVQLTALKRMN
ncbi:MAG: prepilin-type N-terminal cleavage/methylation domain-containing protein [Myxococcota bacterium]